LKFITLVAVCTFLCGTVAANNNPTAMSDEDWNRIMDKVALLEDSGLMPTLLPTILKNKDALQLTDEQVDAFQSWRQANYANMVSVMNQIIEKQVQFRVESLSANVGSEHLLAFQGEIQDLQRQLLQIKLSCRQLVMSTFTAEQWENFAFVVEDNPKLASLFSQVGTTTESHIP
jgi:hypothetical protein